MCYRSETWTVDSKRVNDSNKKNSAGTWSFDLYEIDNFWKTHFPECFEIENWTVGTRYKKIRIRK